MTAAWQCLIIVIMGWLVVELYLWGVLEEDRAELERFLWWGLVRYWALLVVLLGVLYLRLRKETEAPAAKEPSETPDSAPSEDA